MRGPGRIWSVCPAVGSRPPPPCRLAEGLGCGEGHRASGAQWACARAAPVRAAAPPPASRGLSPGRCARISPCFVQVLYPPNSSVTPPRRALYPSGGAKRTGDAVNPGVPGRGGRFPPDSQNSPLPQARAPQLQRLTPAPTPPERATSGRRARSCCQDNCGESGRRRWAAALARCLWH